MTAREDGGTAFTPGPWRVVLGRVLPDTEVFGYGVFPVEPTIVLPPGIAQHSIASGNLYEHSAFHAFFTPEVIEANANLIAAAPDLYAVVRELVSAIATDKSIIRNPAFESDDATWLLDRARSALAKAEGRT